MKAKSFQEQVKALFLKQFPNGYINISKLALGGGINIRCGLIGDKNDVANQIRENDPMSISIFIHDNFVFNDEEVELGELVLEFKSSRIDVRTDEQYFYCKSHKIPARKIKANPEKALSRLDTYFGRCKAIVTEQASQNNIIKQENIDPKYL